MYPNPYGYYPPCQPYCAPQPNYQPLNMAFILVLFILLVIILYNNQRPQHCCRPCD